jgi:hypothetical protein
MLLDDQPKHRLGRGGSNSSNRIWLRVISSAMPQLAISTSIRQPVNSKDQHPAQIVAVTHRHALLVVRML